VSIGALFHVTHVAEDLGTLDSWYDRVLVPWRGMMESHHLPDGEREGSLLVIGDAVVETVAPGTGPASTTSAIGRFQAKFGRHWHSLAWYCDDVGAAWERLSSHGVRTVSRSGPITTRPEEGDIYTHPKDTCTQLELYQPPASHGGPGGTGLFPDPRPDPTWAARWAARANPLAIERLAYVTVAVADLDRAVAVYRDALGGTVICEEANRLAGTDSVYVRVGTGIGTGIGIGIGTGTGTGTGIGTVVELARPVEPDGLAGRDVARFGDTCHAVAFYVRDLEEAAGGLSRAGVAVIARDETTLLADPSDTFGAAMRFTTDQVPGDPRSP